MYSRRWTNISFLDTLKASLIHKGAYFGQYFKRRRGVNCTTVIVFFYPRDAMLALVIVIATCLSVRPSVCLSVTRRYCVKTKKASGMISSPPGSLKTLVF